MSATHDHYATLGRSMSIFFVFASLIMIHLSLAYCHRKQLGFGAKIYLAWEATVNFYSYWLLLLSSYHLHNLLVGLKRAPNLILISHLFVVLAKPIQYTELMEHTVQHKNRPLSNRTTGTLHTPPGRFFLLPYTNYTQYMHHCTHTAGTVPGALRIMTQGTRTVVAFFLAYGILATTQIL